MTVKAGMGTTLERERSQLSERANRLSSGSATMSMDISVSMDVSRTQEEPVDITGQPSRIEASRNEDLSNGVNVQDASRRQQVDRVGSAANKRRKIVNSKLYLATIFVSLSRSYE